MEQDRVRLLVVIWIGQQISIINYSPIAFVTICYIMSCGNGYPCGTNPMGMSALPYGYQGKNTLER